MTAPRPDSASVLERLDRQVPAALAARAAAFDGDPAPARLAATVLLVRDVPGSAPSLRVLVQRRHRSMAFAGGVIAFPGGGGQEGESAQDTAIREMAEETGVWLTGSDLRRWAHWITPRCEPRRYDTHFFVAELPVGQRAGDLSTETVQTWWADPAAVLADAGDGTVLPPTRAMLLELGDCPDVAAAMARTRGRRIASICPEIVRSTEGWTFRWGIEERTGASGTQP